MASVTMQRCHRALFSSRPVFLESIRTTTLRPTQRAYCQCTLQLATSLRSVQRRQCVQWQASTHHFAKRSFHSSPKASHGHLTPPKEGEGRKITFIDKEGRRNEFIVGDGNNLLDIAQANDLEMEGACGGSCACSTCHVIVEDDEMFNKMEEPSDDENDMLDLAYGLTETSRLGCQINMSKELDGLVVRLPAMSRNVQASDFVEKERKG